MMHKKGTIGLDIDGTVTAERHVIPENVQKYLKTLVESGWEICFITGRPYNWAIKSLETLPFSYKLSAYNGAVTIQMPDQKILHRHYIGLDSLRKINEDVIFYGGFEQQDRCYYCPTLFDPNLLEYLKFRSGSLTENWIALSSFDDLPIQKFASIKSFGKNGAKEYLDRFLSIGLHASSIRDPVNPDYSVVQGTHSKATKGAALKEIAGDSRIIAAGDDENDRTMLEIADISIAMGTASDSIQALADIVAPPATDEGIIQGLKEAIG